MSTLDFYQEMPNVDQAMFVDVEARLHVKAFEEATEAYVAEKYAESIQLFNNALDEWYEEFADCRALCERPVDFGEKYKEELPGYHKYQVAHMSLGCKICLNFFDQFLVGEVILPVLYFGRFLLIFSKK